jgi:hypothetical protein
MKTTKTNKTKTATPKPEIVAAVEPKVSPHDAAKPTTEQPAPAAEKPAAKKGAAKKTAKVADDALRIRLYAKGEFYFGKVAAARINGAAYMEVAVKGKTITLTPTKSSKDAQKVGFCHAAPVLRVAKLLADTGWSKETQDLVAKAHGEAGFSVVVS